MLVTELAPNTTYTVSIEPAGGGSTILVDAGNTGGVTDAAGALMLTF